MQDSLLAAAVGIISNDFDKVAGGVPSFPTDEPDFVNLGKPSELTKEARKRLRELEEVEVADLRQREQELRAEIAKENETIAAGIYNIEEELAKGTSREELSKRKADAEVAEEIASVRRKELAKVAEEIKRKHKKWAGNGDRIMNWALKIETNTRGAAITFIRGGNRLEPKRQKTAFLSLIRFEQEIRELFNDDEFVDAWIDELTTLEMFTGPRSQHKALFSMLHGQDKAELEHLNPFNDEATTNEEATNE